MGIRLERIRDLANGKLGLLQVRSPKWSEVRTAFVKEHPTCEVCGGTDKRQVHHIQPFHTHPERELDPSNLITLCESKAGNHHLWWGHLGSFKSWNMDVREDAKKWGAKIRARPY